MALPLNDLIVPAPTVALLIYMYRLLVKRKTERLLQALRFLNQKKQALSFR